jgi:DNA repair protein SbcD/Mre11
MRILHTSDWHVGRRLGRHDRTAEFEAVLSEVAEIADARSVDLVIVSGDVFDRPVPPVDALTMGLGALLKLAEGRTVIAVAGNHDSPDLFDALAPLLRNQGRGVHLVGSIRRPGDGGVLGPDVLGVPAAVACFPFLREGRVVDFMREAGEWYGAYAERVQHIAQAYNEALVAMTDGDIVPILTAHFMVGGVRVDGHGAPRGERELHMGQAYAATAQAIPPGPQYVAMGHIHNPQPVPGAPVPAEYAGSLLALDFGEAGEVKRVAIVDVEPGQLATVTSVPLRSGRELVRATGTWAELLERQAELADAYVDLTVRVGGLDTDLGRRAADAFPYLVNVRPLLPQAERPARPDTAERPSDESMYVDHYRATAGEDPPEELIALFRSVMGEVADATA